MAWNPTNTDDVTLIVSEVFRDESGTRTGSGQVANSSLLVVDDFSIDSEQDLQSLSGVGNNTPQGISKGDINHSFSFTVQGEDADAFTTLMSSAGITELEIVVTMEDYKDKLTGAFVDTRSVSGSSGDPVEVEVEGVATERFPGDV